MVKHKNLAVNAVLNTIKTVLGIIFPLISYPYISRVLGVNQIGIYNFSASMISYFQLIAGLGISTYAIREGMRYRDDTKKMNEFVTQIFSLNIFSTLIAYMLLAVLLICVPFLHQYTTAILILSTEILFTTVGVSWICNIYEDFLFITVRTLFMQIISLVAMFIFVRSEWDLYVYIAIVVFANSGANILNFFYVRKKYCRFGFVFHCQWKNHIKSIIVMFSTSIAMTIYVSSDTTILGFMTSDYEVGLYSTAVKIYTIIKNVLVALVTVLIPRFLILFRVGEYEKLCELFSKVFNILTMLLIPTAVGMFALSDDIVFLISGIEYIKASETLKLLSIAVVFSLYACLYTQCILIPVKKEKIVFRNAIISAIVNIGLNFVLIPFWGMNAAAITTIIAEFIMFFLSYLSSKKEIKLFGVKKNIIVVIVGCIIIVVICFLCRNINNVLIRIIVSVLLSMMSYGAILVMTGNKVLITVRNKIFCNKITK